MMMTKLLGHLAFGSSRCSSQVDIGFLDTSVVCLVELGDLLDGYLHPMTQRQDIVNINK
jgi:hypothetical protein